VTNTYLAGRTHPARRLGRNTRISPYTQIVSVRHSTGVVLACFASIILSSATPHSAYAADVAPFLGEIPLTDVLTVVVVQREVIAIDARASGETRETLRLEEEVLWTGSRGRVGVAITDRRILAAATESGRWARMAFRRTETRPKDALLGERVALVLTNERIIGFNGGTGSLIEESLGVKESVFVHRVGENVGIVVTNRRAIGLSPFAGGFSEISLGLKERIDSVNADANIATVVTDRRILIYRSPSGSWSERRLDLK